jgi:hypothetical protein
VVVMLPENKMALPPGVPPNFNPAILWYGPGTLPVQVWLPPPGEPKAKKGKKEAE